MKPDSRTPVIIGVAQVSATPSTEEEYRAAADAMTLMAQAIDVAAADTGRAGVLGELDVLAVVGGAWRYDNPGALIAAELGLADVSTIRTSFGGQIPIHMAAELCERIASGEIDVAVMTGGENNLSRRALNRLGIERVFRTEAPESAVEVWGPRLEMGDETAVARGAEQPRNSYAVLDSAIRARRGETLDEARDRAAALWAGYAAVAVDNPHAADRSGMTAAAIRTPSDHNRLVSWPYTKAMCANNHVDHAGAIILASTEAADRLGIAPEQRVFPHLCVNSMDTPTLVGRDDVAAVPGLAAATARLAAEIGPLDAIDHLDLYACFPSIVTLTTELFGVSHERPLTVTGGLAFAGAPFNFAAGESLVGMVRRLRSEPGSVGLVQGNGGHATKHSLATYSTTPPAEAHRILDVRSDVAPRPPADPDRSGPAILDGVTVDFERGGPSRAIALVRFSDETRTWATSDDPSVMAAVMAEETVGTEVGVDRGQFRL